MKLLYIAPVPIDFSKPDGVAKKILSHVKVFSKSFNTSLIYRNGGSVFIYRANEDKNTCLNVGTSKVDILKAAKQLIKKEQFDCSYIRYPQSDPWFVSLLKEMKRHNIQIVVEIPTFPYDAEGSESIKGKIIRRMDMIYRHKLRKYISRIVTYSDDKRIFGIPTINTINGFDFSNMSVLSSVPSDTIHFCAVSGMFKVHGYDRLIEGIYEYYHNGGKREIVFDIVGEGYASEPYKELVKKYNLESRVVFHGKCFGDMLDAIYNQASIGVNSLAIHRQNLKRESTLKTREYAAKGLPMISSSYIDALNTSGNRNYVFMIPADESPVDVNKVIDFYDEIYANQSIDVVRKRIRENSIATCDMAITLQPIIDLFCNKNNV